MKKKIIYIALLVFGVHVLHAQSYDNLIAATSEGNDIAEVIPSISELQALAIENSPLLKLYDADIVIREMKVQLLRREWMNGLGVEAGVKYGLFDNLVISQDLGYDQSQAQTTEQTRYNLGITWKLPLLSLAGGKNKSMAIAEKEKAQYQREASVKELKELIIIQYGNIIRAHRKLVIYIAAVESMRTQMIEADVNYKNGIIDMADYARLQNMQLNAEISYEEAKTELITAMRILQENIGTEINLNLGN
ncbi:TolC family protein [Draconibacterium orientale]|nr:TolC family protein [Draconibacterium orientale]